MNERLQELYRQSIQFTNSDECLDMPNKQMQRLILTKYAALVRQDYLRDLKALKPVAWQVMDENDALREFSIKDIAQDWITTELLRGSSIVYWIRPLYALDEAKHD